MLTEVKNDLKKMKTDRPGERFSKQHKRAKENGLATGWGRIICVFASFVSFVIGVVLVFFPGPAFVFFILSGVMLASQWKWVADLMDRGEVKGRKMWKNLRAKWKGSKGKSAKPAARTGSAKNAKSTQTTKSAKSK